MPKKSERRRRYLAEYNDQYKIVFFRLPRTTYDECKALSTKSKRSLTSLLQEIIESTLAEGIDAQPARLERKNQSAA